MSKLNSVKELRISGVSEDIIDELKIIASNHDQTLASFMKPHLRAIVKNTPEEFKRKRPSM